MCPACVPHLLLIINRLVCDIPNTDMMLTREESKLRCVSTQQELKHLICCHEANFNRVWCFMCRCSFRTLFSDAEQAAARQLIDSTVSVAKSAVIPQNWVIGCSVHFYMLFGLNVTLEHKTSLKCQFFDIEIYASSEILTKACCSRFI